MGPTMARVPDNGVLGLKEKFLCPSKRSAFSLGLGRNQICDCHPQLHDSWWHGPGGEDVTSVSTLQKRQTLQHPALLYFLTSPSQAAGPSENSAAARTVEVGKLRLSGPGGATHAQVPPSSLSG